MLIPEPRIQSIYVIIGNQLLFVWCILNIFEAWYIPLMILNIHIFGMFWEVGIHRYWSHNSFKTTKLKERLLLAFAFLTGQGSILSWCNVHRHHHKYEDTELDPHSPSYENWFRIYLGLFKNPCKDIFVRDLIRHQHRKYLTFENKYYALMWTLAWIISYAISPILFFWLVTGSAIWWIATYLITIFAHQDYVGSKLFSEAKAQNSQILNLITGMGNHNNHHKYPASHTNKIDREIDIHAWIIEKFFIK